MKTLIIYDTAFGHTAEIAFAIADKIKNSETHLANEVEKQQIDEADLIIIGTPTITKQSTLAIQELLEEKGSLKNKKVAVFDTRYATTEHGIGLRLLKKTLGSAASKIAEILKSQGANLVIPPEGFIVTDTETDLQNSEIERAQNWAKKISKTMSEI